MFAAEMRPPEEAWTPTTYSTPVPGAVGLGCETAGRSSTEVSSPRSLPPGAAAEISRLLAKLGGDERGLGHLGRQSSNALNLSELALDAESLAFSMSATAYPPVPFVAPMEVMRARVFSRERSHRGAGGPDHSYWVRGTSFAPDIATRLRDN